MVERMGEKGLGLVGWEILVFCCHVSNTFGFGGCLAIGGWVRGRRGGLLVRKVVKPRNDRGLEKPVCEQVIGRLLRALCRNKWRYGRKASRAKTKLVKKDRQREVLSEWRRDIRWWGCSFRRQWRWDRGDRLGNLVLGWRRMREATAGTMWDGGTFGRKFSFIEKPRCKRGKLFER
jgi:hypothetical protein